MKTLSKCKIFSGEQKNAAARSGISPSARRRVKLFYFAVGVLSHSPCAHHAAAISAGTLFRGGFGIGACLGIGCGRIGRIFEIRHYLFVVGLSIR